MSLVRQRRSNTGSGTPLPVPRRLRPHDRVRAGGFRRGRSLSRLAILVLLMLAAAVHAAPASAAQGRLLRVVMSVAPDLASSETTVRLRYLLRPGGDAIVPLSIVLFDSAEVSMVQASVNGLTLGLDELAGPASHQSGEIRLGPSAAASDSLPIELVYTVRTRGAGTGERIRVPVLAVTWPPVEATPGTFHATLVPPPGHEAYDPLPSMLRENRSDVGALAYEATLQVVPAMFSFRLTEGRAPRIGLSGFLDLTVLVLLAGFTWIGWRHFKAGD